MIESKAKKWGGSFGFIISKRDAEILSLKENQEVMLDIIPKTNTLKEMFGTFKTKESTETILKEIRRGETKHI
jgi:antitoxin component of MazEF toxin-antitoxin module